MTTLVRTNQPRSDSSKTKVLVVRQPGSKPVGSNETTPETALRVSIGVVATVGVLITIWLIGHIGYSLGFAATMRVPGLSISPDAAFSSGVIVLLKTPRMVFELGLANPMWLMLGFILIAIPAGSLAAADPPRKGGPRPSQFAVVMSYIGASAGLLNAAALVGWVISPTRHAMIREIPLDPANAELWIVNLQSVAGIDALAMVCAAVWVVLIFRLSVPTWMKAIASSATIFTLALVLISFATSSGAASQLDAPRADCIVSDQPESRVLLIGQNSRQTVVLAVRNGQVLVELHGEPQSYTSLGRLSVAQFMWQQMDAAQTQ